MSRRTVIRIKQRFVQENLEIALTGSFPCERPERRCLDGKGEALYWLLGLSVPKNRKRTALPEEYHHVSGEFGFSPHARDIQVQMKALSPTRGCRRDDRGGNRLGCAA